MIKIAAKISRRINGARREKTNNCGKTLGIKNYILLDKQKASGKILYAFACFGFNYGWSALGRPGLSFAGKKRIAAFSS
jgi:hypothetical protein